jgi:hypothetical protein
MDWGGNNYMAVTKLSLLNWSKQESQVCWKSQCCRPWCRNSTLVVANEAQSHMVNQMQFPSKLLH